MRRLLTAAEVNTSRLDLLEQDPVPCEQSFTVTDGRDIWTVNHTVDLRSRDQNDDPNGGVICFTPGTMIRTESGLMRTEEIGGGTRVRTKDNGCQKILWTGARRITGARLYARRVVSSTEAASLREDAA